MMIAIDKYGQMYLAMTGAAANPEEQTRICSEQGVSLNDWNEAQAFYMAKMSDPADMGKTAMELAKYMMPQNAVLDASPVDFNAAAVNLYVNEYQVQMAEFISGHLHVVLQCGVSIDPNDEFLTNYVQGRVHMSVNDQGYSIYGGVEHVELSRDKLVFHFDEEGKERMKRSSLAVTFQISNTKYAYLERTLYHMYRDHPVLVLSKEKPPVKENWNGIDYDLTWDSFGLENTGIVNIRPHIANLQQTGIYDQNVVITFENEGTTNQLFESFLNEMIAVMESDYETIIAMVMCKEEHNLLFLYTQLSEGDFMGRINTALCYLPNLPLGFSGNHDPEWNNYNECRKDYLSIK